MGRETETLMKKATEKVIGGPMRRLVRHSVEWTVRDCIAKYPSLFQSRTQVLHHVFVVLGCGYEWEKGKLVGSKMGPPRKFQIPPHAVEILAAHTMPIEHPYPWCDMCNLAEMPTDADEDWKAAGEEIRAACGLANAGVDLPDTAAQDSASKSNNPAVSG
jgi:hypothetical protein